MKNIYKLIFILIFQSIINQQSFSQQAPAIEWQNTIGGNDLDELRSIQQTSDGGYILGGRSTSNISGDKTEDSFGDWDYWVIKLDFIGNIQWQNTIRGEDSDRLHSIQQTSDGGYILGGSSSSDYGYDKTENSLGNFDYWVVKINSTGNIQWENTIGGNASDQLFSVRQTFDGGYILGGTSNSPISGDKTENNWDPTLTSSDFWVIKLDASGNIMWQNTIGGNSGDDLFTLQQVIDGGYILGGCSSSDISGDKNENSNGLSDFWLIKLDSTGNIMWQNDIGGSDEDVLLSIQQSSDGGFIFVGASKSNISGDKNENCLGWEDYWVVKTDSMGNIEWQNTIGGNDWDHPTSIQQTFNGSYIVGGWSLSNISGDKTENQIGGLGFYDYWVIRLDSVGNIEWQNTIGGNESDILNGVCETSDSGFILGGFSYSDISGDKTENSNGFSDYWVIKLAPDTITGIRPAQSALGGKGVTIAPNPLVTQSTITFTNPHKERFLFTLYDITGRVIETVSTATEQIILNKGSKQAGLYLFSLRNEKTGEKMNGKIVVE